MDTISGKLIGAPAHDGGLRALGANHGPSKHGVFTEAHLDGAERLGEFAVAAPPLLG